MAGSRFKDRWTVVPRALSDAPGRAEFCVASMALSMFDGLRDTHRVPVARSVTVEVSTLDAEWERLGRPPVSVVKCDVEGNELAILDGEGHVGRRHPGAHLVRAVADDDAQARGPERARGVQHVLEQGPAREPVQDLGQVREHALALARGQDDDLEHGPGALLALAQLADGLDAVLLAAQAQVGQHDVGRVLGGQSHGLVGAGRQGHAATQR